MALLNNALEASQSTVFFSAKCSGEFLDSALRTPVLECLRRYCGMWESDSPQRKKQARGWALECLLPGHLPEQLGGSLTYESSVGAGTVAVLELPMKLEPEAWQTNERN